MNALLPSVPLSLQRERDRMISVLDDIAAGRMAAGDEDGQKAADAGSVAVGVAPDEGAAKMAALECALGLLGISAEEAARLLGLAGAEVAL